MILHIVQDKLIRHVSDSLSIADRSGASYAVLTHTLCTNKQTLENWEQSRTRPNGQSATLIRLVESYPDTVERLAGIS